MSEEGPSGPRRAGAWERALVRLAVAGNGLFVAWVVYNAIDSGFRGTTPEIVSGLALVALLALETVLLVRRPRA